MRELVLDREKANLLAEVLREILFIQKAAEENAAGIINVVEETAKAAVRLKAQEKGIRELLEMADPVTKDMDDREFLGYVAGRHENRGRTIRFLLM